MHKTFLNQLNNSEIRTTIDERAEKVGRKIRDAEVRKIPFMIIVGEKEKESKTLNYRKHGEGDQGSIEVGPFIEMIQKEVNK